MRQPENTKCSLDIECRFISDRVPVFNGELICETMESEAVAKQTFYLLDRSAEEILKKYKNIIWGRPPGKPDLCFPDADKILGKYIHEILSGTIVDPCRHLIALKHIASLMSDDTPMIRTSYLIALNILCGRAIRVLKTDRQGTAKTRDLRPGTYFICGVLAMGKATRVWNVRINIKPGANSLALDDRNRYDFQ